MKYIDLHCDALTKTEGVFQVTREKLKEGGCLLQCFAAFIEGTENRFARTAALAETFQAMCRLEGYNVVRSFSDLRADRINAMFTVEEGGAVEGSIEKLEALYACGARMLTLTWNYPNEIGYPNFPDYDAVLMRAPQGGIRGSGSPYLRETVLGLTPFGFEAVERMQQLGMIVDVSHGSDALFSDVAALSKASGRPFVASHSGAAAIRPWARNLTDSQIRTLADCGGVTGLPFCAAFLSEDVHAEGQKRALLAHAAHIVETGGEDVLAIGSDFDGIPRNAYMTGAQKMPLLLEEFSALFGARVAEKIASGNALRVFREALR